jgi:hypothetical protein
MVPAKLNRIIDDPANGEVVRFTTTAPTKFCRACEQWKPMGEFGEVKKNPDGRRYACKECYNGVRKMYRENHGDRIAAYKRELYYASHEENKKRLRELYPQRRAWKLMNQYGMTVEQYDQILKDQDGKCAICRRPPTQATGNSTKPQLHVDHCHFTGTVRGLLCNNCNSGMGLLGDSIEMLNRASAYLKKHQPPGAN